MKETNSSLSCLPAIEDCARPLAEYHPSVWGDFFIHHARKGEDCARMQQIRAEELKDQVSKAISVAAAAATQREYLGLVDALQRLGLAYLFEEEIDRALASIHAAAAAAPADRRHNSKEGVVGDQEEDIHHVSLRFRLLRQAGYGDVAADVFTKFKNGSDGNNFCVGLASDARGMLSLYDAAHLYTPDDPPILEEAIAFCRGHLETMLSSGHLEAHLAEEVAQSLDVPLVRRLPRLDARRYISLYEARRTERNDLLLELAKLDFNILQAQHQQELRSLSQWWKELGIIRKLSFARDRLVETYFWSSGAHYEPYYGRTRMMMTKLIVFISILDDIYDAYGTLEELTLITDIIQRWELTTSEDDLPEYAKIYLAALDNLFKEFEQELREEKKSYQVEFLKDELKSGAIAYFEEAKWCNQGYIPMFEEHLTVSLISSGYKILACASFMGNEKDIATKETFDWLANFPATVKASCMHCRLTDDIASHEFEQNRQHVASTVQSYMKEYGTSKEETLKKLCTMIEDCWKIINAGTSHKSFGWNLPVINLTRVMEAYYKKIDGYTHSSSMTKSMISLLFVEEI